MKALMFCVALAMLTVSALFTAPVSAAEPDGAKAEQEIRDRAKEFSAAWQKHDAKLIADFYVPDGEMVTAAGQAYAGRDGIEEILRGAFNESLKDSSFIWTVEKVKLVKPDVAIADYDAQIKGSDPAAEGVKFHVVAVLVKQNGKWLTQTTRGIADGPSSVSSHRPWGP